MTASRFLILRHGETVYNAARVLQTNTMHAPLTARGFRQAIAMGEAIRDETTLQMVRRVVALQGVRRIGLCCCSGAARGSFCGPSGRA